MKQYGIPRFQAKIIVHTGLQMSEFFEETCNLYGDSEVTCNWLVTYLLKSLNYEGLSLKESKLKPETFTELLQLIDDGTISERLAKELIKDYVKTGKSPRLLVKEKNLGLLSEDELEIVVGEVIIDFPQAVADYNGGKIKAAEYLIGQVLRRIRARATASDVRRLVLEELNRG